MGRSEKQLLGPITTRQGCVGREEAIANKITSTGQSISLGGSEPHTPGFSTMNKLKGIILKVRTGI